MSLFVALLFVVGLVWLGHKYWLEARPTDDLTQIPGYGPWIIKGLAVPLLLWSLINIGAFPGMPPFIPRLVGTASAWDRAHLLVGSIPGLLFLFGTFWAAVTFIWILAAIRVRIRPEQREDFTSLAGAWLLVLSPFAALLIWSVGAEVAGLAVLIWLLPPVHCSVGLVPTHKVAPMYSRAIARLKMGKFEEAEWEIIRQLERCEDDFEGWMFLAELYALRYHDMPLAESTIRDLCNQPNITPSEFGVAMHRLADWHLQLAGDPLAAANALGEICRKYPQTHLEHMARVRIEQLPSSREEYRARQQGVPLKLPAVSDALESLGPPAQTLSPEELLKQANLCVEQLQQAPDNSAVREQFARLLADMPGQVDRALEQVELLLRMEDQPVERRAEWQSLKAAWLTRQGQDPEAARQALLNLVRDYPGTTQAFTAQRRLQLMDVEARLGRNRQKPA